MKQTGVVAVFSTILISLLFTGFQCGSTEMTSARLYIQRSDWANAEAALAKETAKNPANAEAWYLLGRARLELKNYEGMIDALNQSLAASNKYEKEISQIKLSAWANMFNQAIVWHNKVADGPKDSAAVYTQYAVDLYTTAIKANPDSAQTYQNLAALYHVQGKFDEELVNLKKARERKPTPELSNFIIAVYMKKAEEAKAQNDTVTANQNYDLALEELRQARELNPDDQELLGTMINIYIETNRAKEAIPYIREALEKDPANMINHNNLGLLLLEDNQYTEAIEHFEAALAVDENYEVALRNGAVAYMKLGEAMKEEAVKKADPKKKETLDKSYTEKFKSAATLLERLTKTKADDPNIWDALATAYGNAGMFKEAKDAIEKADALRKK